MSDKLPISKTAVELLAFLILGVVIWQVYMGYTLSEVGVPGIFVIKFSNNTPTAEEILDHENLLVSNYHNMYLNEKHQFGAYVALDDSVEEALIDLPTGSAISNGKITPTFGNKSNVTMVSTNQTMSVGTRVNLTGQTFDIMPADSLTSGPQDIPHGNPGQNIAKWRWWVIPREEGSHSLFIEAYTVDKEGHRTSINSTQKQIDVIVSPAVSTPALIPPAARGTDTAEGVEEAPAVNETEVVAEEDIHGAARKAEEAVEETAEAATEPATPGFDSIFAITGFLAVAYFILGKRE